jgi:hypothetical protein
VNDILLAEDFGQEHLKGFEAAKEYKRLDDYQKDPGSGLAAQDGWIEASVPISVPCDSFPFKRKQMPLFLTSKAFFIENHWKLSGLPSPNQQPNNSIPHPFWNFGNLHQMRHQSASILKFIIPMHSLKSTPVFVRSPAQIVTSKLLSYPLCSGTIQHI